MTKFINLKVIDPDSKRIHWEELCNIDEIKCIDIQYFQNETCKITIKLKYSSCVHIYKEQSKLIAEKLIEFLSISSLKIFDFYCVSHF